MITIGRFFAALVLSVLCITAASAQTASSWLPSFSRDQHVYVAPAVNGILSTNFSSIPFKLDLAPAARRHQMCCQPTWLATFCRCLRPRENESRRPPYPGSA